MIDRELLGDASNMKINLLTALHFIAEAWKQITPTTIENCFKKCGFSSDGEYIDVNNDVLNDKKRMTGTP
jgi:DDE superfamily endonuclease.